jgi:hypothetical protein
MTETRMCANCGVLLPPPSRAPAKPRKYCGDTCRQQGRAKPITLACTQCGTEFRTWFRDQQFCGDGCRVDATRKPETPCTVEPEPETKTCAFDGCDQTFVLTQQTRRFCTDDCRRKAGRQARTSGQAGRAVVLARRCPRCKETFQTTIAAQIYCSRTCYQTARRYGERVCAQDGCDTVFEPAGRHARFCSPRCIGMQRTNETRRCIVCNAEYRAKQYRQRYCSDECGHRGRSKAGYVPLAERQSSLLAMRPPSPREQLREQEVPYLIHGPMVAAMVRVEAYRRLGMPEPGTRCKADGCGGQLVLYPGTRFDVMQCRLCDRAVWEIARLPLPVLASEVRSRRRAAS